MTARLGPRPALRALPFAALSLCLVSASDCDTTDTRQVSQSTVIVSTSAAGVQADGPSDSMSMSADGNRVAFLSTATNLVPDQGLAQRHVYVKDRSSGAVILATRDINGVPTWCDPKDVSISEDGRYVVFVAAFQLDNPKLGATATHAPFVVDLQTKLVRAAIAGIRPNQNCSSPSVARDGQRVVFVSAATNMGFANPSTLAQVYFCDGAAAPLLISRGGSTTQVSNAHALTCRISADGATVAYASGATNIHPGDTDIQKDVYVATIGTGTVTTEVASLNSAGLKGNGACTDPDLSSDGRIVSFTAQASNMAPGIQNIMVRDRAAATTRCMTLTPDGHGPQSGVGPARISADGRFVAFLSQSPNHTLQVILGTEVYLTGPSGVTQLVSVNDFGIRGGANVFGSVAVSAAGPWVAWSSPAATLAPDLNGFLDVFVRGPYEP